MGMERQSCEGCPDCEIRITPDPDDWFCDDDVTVLCKAVSGGYVMVEQIRPYLVHERCPVPHWCPKRKQKKVHLVQQMQASASNTNKTSNTPKRNTVLAAAVVLSLCLASVVAVRFKAYDPAASADSDTFFDYCIFAGMVLLPVASVCFAKSLFIGRRFRFLLSWLVGFMIPWAVLVYEMFYPKTPPEGSYCTRAEECLGIAIFVAVITGAINGIDSLVGRLLEKWDNALTRNWLFLFAARLAGTILLSSLIVVLLSGMSNAL